MCRAVIGNYKFELSIEWQQSYTNAWFEESFLSSPV